MKYLIFTLQEGGEYQTIKDPEGKYWEQVRRTGSIKNFNIDDTKKVYFAVSVQELDNFDFSLDMKRPDVNTKEYVDKVRAKYKIK